MMRNLQNGVGLVVAVLLVLAPGAAWAQSSVSTGQIFGTVTDPDGAALPGVSVEAKNKETGFARRTVCDGSGFFRIDLLPPGTYDVRADLTGFQTSVQGDVNVTLGSSVRVNHEMTLGAVEQEIVVTAESPIVEVTNPSVTSSVSERAIANLPLQGRDFTDLVLLTPGSVAGDPDQVADGRGGINIGARAIQNSFNIDGANSQSSFFGEERGGTRPPFTFSQAAIKEFQVLKSSYNLQFQATGGVINAITKSGTNSFHGQVFGYYTDDSLTDEDAFGRKEDSKQQQYGFALGGPFVRDKLHFFTSLDVQDFQTPHFTEFEDFPVGREARFNELTLLDYDLETSNYPTTNDAQVFMFKLDWQAGQNNLFAARFNYSDQEGVNQTSGFSNTGLSNNGLEGNSFSSLVFTLNSVINENAFNEAFVQYAFEERPRAANSELPEAGVWQFRAAWGRNQFLPNFLDEERWQLVDNFTYYMGNHTLKAGLNFDLVTFDDGFCRYCSGAYSYNEWEGEEEGFLDEGTPFSYTQAFSESDGTVVFDTNYYALYVQDDWRASPNLTVNYGIRYDLQANPTPEVTNPLWPDTGQIPDDGDNWSARAGIAWDIRGDGRSVLRAGVGRFYDNSPTLLTANALLANGVTVVRVNAFCQFGDDCPTWPNTWDSLGDLEGAVGDIFVFSPDYENPETNRISVGYEQQVGGDFALGVDVIYYETHKLQVKQDQNIFPTGETTLDGRPVYDDGLDPNFDQIIQFNSNVDAEYLGIVLFARKRFSNNWFLDASYTWSDAKDANSNERSVSSSSQFPEDQYNIDGDWGPSDFDVTSKFVASLSWQLPYNFMVSAIGFYRSGYPYSAGDARDNNGDSYRNERALIDDTAFHFARNTERQPSASNFDLRLSWTARLGRGLELELIGEAFNVTNQDNLYSSSSRQELINSDGEVNDRFGQLNQAGLPRRYQLGARFRF